MPHSSLLRGSKYSGGLGSSLARYCNNATALCMESSFKKLPFCTKPRFSKKWLRNGHKITRPPLSMYNSSVSFFLCLFFCLICNAGAGVAFFAKQNSWSNAAKRRSISEGNSASCSLIHASSFVSIAAELFAVFSLVKRDCWSGLGRCSFRIVSK